MNLRYTNKKYMNYDNVNKTGDYWKEKIAPNLQTVMYFSSFEYYLKRMSGLPSGKWLEDSVNVMFLKIPYLLDTELFLSHYKKKCVSFITPPKPEDGVHRIIYQISPTLHVEASLWMWIEKNEVYSYVGVFACANKYADYMKFCNEVEKFKHIGDTENSGFGFSTSAASISSKGVGFGRE